MARPPPLLPRSVSAFEKMRASFEAWLVARGSGVKRVTNPYEVIRFLGPNCDCIVYRNERDSITHWAYGAQEAFYAFLQNSAWRAVPKGGRHSGRRLGLILSIADRDGWSCVYCGRETGEPDVTLEHMLSITAGGTSHLSNLALAHRCCNAEASHLPVREKLEMALRMRAKETIGG